MNNKIENCKLEKRISTYIFNALVIRKKNVMFSSQVELNGETADFIVSDLSLLTCFRIILNPKYWVAELYSRGEWELKKGDLSNFLLYVTENLKSPYNKYFNFLERSSFFHTISQNILTKYFTRKVKNHYNLDPEIYSSFLDDEMVYTCAFYENNNNLSEAQENKYKTIIDRLGVQDRECKILNIGCGWSSFERFVVTRKCNAHIVGLSISDVQVKWSNKHNMKLLKPSEISRIDLKIEDYIDHNPENKYDFVTAIGMVEHVGMGDYSEFFEKTYNILKPCGKMLIHMIVKTESNIPTNSWIDKYIFPGGYSPSPKEILNASEKFFFRLEGVYIHHSINYKKTLQDWRKNLYRNKKVVLDIYKHKYKYNKEISNYMFRQWEIYLAGSEASFSKTNKPQQIAQFLFSKTS